MTTCTATNACDDRRTLDHGKIGAPPAAELSPMGLHLNRKSYSNPSSPNFLQQPKPFEFSSTASISCQRLTAVRPTSASHFGRCATAESLINCTSFANSHPPSLLLSRSLSPPRFPHGQAPQLSAVETTGRSKSYLNICSELIRTPTPTAKNCNNHFIPTVRVNNGRKKQVGKKCPTSRKSPTSRLFPVLAANTSLCHQTNNTNRNLADRWQLNGEFQAVRGTRIGTKMNKGREEASCSNRNSDECYRMVELRRNILEAAASEAEGGRGSVDSDNSFSNASVRRISGDERSNASSASSLRARMSLLGKSLSIDANCDNPIPCRDFGIRDYLTMTGESIDNEEESSLAGDFATGLGVIPPRFSIDSIDSQLAILQELKESSRNSFSSSSSTSSTATSVAPLKETFRRYSEDIGMLSSAAQRKLQSSSGGGGGGGGSRVSPPPPSLVDADAVNHGEVNSYRVQDDAKDSSSNKQLSEGRPQLHKSISTPHPSNVISRSPLPKIQEDRYSDRSQVMSKDSVNVNSCERECLRLRMDADKDRRTSGDALLRTWKIEGTLEEFEDDDIYWQSMEDDVSISLPLEEQRHSEK